jgi:hypothetical protein
LNGILAAARIVTDAYKVNLKEGYSVENSRKMDTVFLQNANHSELHAATGM